jgi:hypothetical protein
VGDLEPGKVAPGNTGLLADYSLYTTIFAGIAAKISPPRRTSQTSGNDRVDTAQNLLHSRGFKSGNGDFVQSQLFLCFFCVHVGLLLILKI